MFDLGTATQSIQDLVRELDSVAMMLPAEDQEFLQGCSMAMEMGTPLTPHNVARIRKIYANFQAAQHAGAGLGGEDKSIDLQGVMNKLAQSVQRLAPEERNAVILAARKVQAGGQLNTAEIEEVLNIAKAHGL